jgi:drug/metabolite transporter (DMT)-like permease
MMSAWLGSLFVLLFTLSQSVRDVYFGSVFQRFDFFVVMLLAFAWSTAIFAAATVLRAPSDFAKLRGEFGSIFAANVTTAIAWTSFFFALAHVDPAICNAIHSAMGPLTVVVLGACGIALAKPGAITRIEYAGYAGMAVSVAALWWVVIGGYSSLTRTNPAQTIVGLALLSVSGISITISLLYCKRLQDRGIGADTVMTARFVLLILVAAVMVLRHGSFGMVATPGQFVVLSVAATVLIALPLYAYQLGIGRTSPLTAQIIRALGPVFVFALEQLDGRLHYSLPTLACILFYSASVIASNIAHGWTDESVSSKGFPLTPQAVTRAADDRVNSAISAVGPTPTCCDVCYESAIEG